MKGRQKEKGRGSLQKTSSLALQHLTQRHSLLSPHPYEPLLSLRTSSHDPRPNSTKKPIPNRLLKPAPADKKNTRRKLMRPKLREKRCTVRSEGSIKSQLVTEPCTEPMVMVEKGELNGMLQRNRTLLEQYRTYTEQLRSDRDHYREKYRQVVQRLRKIQHK